MPCLSHFSFGIHTISTLKCLNYIMYYWYCMNNMLFYALCICIFYISIWAFDCCIFNEATWIKTFILIFDCKTYEIWKGKLGKIEWKDVRAGTMECETCHCHSILWIFNIFMWNGWRPWACCGRAFVGTIVGEVNEKLSIGVAGKITRNWNTKLYILVN